MGKREEYADREKSPDGARDGSVHFDGRDGMCWGVAPRGWGFLFDALVGAIAFAAETAELSPSEAETVANQRRQVAPEIDVRARLHAHGANFSSLIDAAREDINKETDEEDNQKHGTAAESLFAAAATAAARATVLVDHRYRVIAVAGPAGRDRKSGTAAAAAREDKVHLSRGCARVAVVQLNDHALTGILSVDCRPFGRSIPIGEHMATAGAREWRLVHTANRQRARARRRLCGRTANIEIVRI